MKKLTLLPKTSALLFIFLSLNLFSQPFTDINADIIGVAYSSVDWGDYDKDGDLDIVISGNQSGNIITKIYRNDAGSFTDINAGLVGLYNGTVAWGDYNGDGDLDLVITGNANYSNDYRTIIYQNNSGTFTNINANLPGIVSSSAIWFDYDNDGDLDLLLGGINKNNSSLTKVFQNSNGDFIDINASLDQIKFSVAVGDYDNDGDLDIYCVESGKLYRNDSGVFLSVTSGLPSYENSSSAWGDYDNDGDLDLVVAGNQSSNFYTKIYRNNSGVFADINAGLVGIYLGGVDWGDYDNDGDLDLILIGYSSTGKVSKVYQNNSGVFSDINAGLLGLSFGSSEWGDYDGDGDLDILLTGLDVGEAYVTKIYTNQSTVINQKSSTITNLSSTVENGVVTLKWDKATDTETPQMGLNYNVYIYEVGQTGYNLSPHSFSASHVNNGRRLVARIGNIQWSINGYKIKSLPPDKTFKWSVQAIDAGLKGGEFVTESSFLVPQYKPLDQATNLILSDIQLTQVTATWSSGKGENRAVFIKETLIGNADPVDNMTYSINDLTPNGWRCVYNGSGNSVLITGLTPRVNYRLHVCEYNGSIGNEKYLTATNSMNPTNFNNQFIEATTIGIPGVKYGSSAWGDYDGDGDLDLVVTGLNNYQIVGSIYRNDEGLFTDINANIEGATKRWVAWIDYDKDGDLDLMLPSDFGIKYYQNNSGIFTNIEIGLSNIPNDIVKFGDYDSDGDIDLAVVYISKLRVFRNNSNTFADINAEIPGSITSFDWGDYDNDSDLDILITGSTSSSYISRIYRNESGIFQDINAGLVGLSSGSSAWGDYDNDGDIDLVITGHAGSSNYLTKIYQNYSGIFVDISAEIIGVNAGSVAWGDYDNDGDLDLIVSGNSNNNSSVFVTRIYRNDSGRFNYYIDGLPGLAYSTVAWGDYDDDGDMDFIVTGQDVLNNCISKIYTNQSNISNQKPSVITNLNSTFENGVVTLTWDKANDNETAQDGLTYNIYVAEVGKTDYTISPYSFPLSNEKNGKRLIAQMGNIQWNSNGYKIKSLSPGKTYKWTVQAIDAGLKGGEFAPENNFSVPQYKPIDQAINILISDIQPTQVKATWGSGGGEKRVVFIKETVGGSADPIDNTTYNLNDVTPNGWKCIYNGTGNSVVVTDLLPHLNYRIHVCEFNGDLGYEKYLTTLSVQNPISFNNRFTEDNTISIAGVSLSSVTWVDYDSDGDLDIQIAGSDIVRIYQNNAGVFTNISTGLPSFYDGEVDWGDYDNDGDLDILLTGNSDGRITRIYRNESGVFNDINAGLIGANGGSVRWGDYDNDGDLDVLVTGSVTTGNASMLYRNDAGVFSQISTGLTGVTNSSVDWGDYDNDGDLDIIIAGSNSSRIYSNDKGVFTFYNANLNGVQYGEVEWGDYDNDGDLDIFLSGQESGGNCISKIYRNDLGVFTDINANLTGVCYSSSAWGDCDNDGDLDILLTGQTNLGGQITKIYINNIATTGEFIESLAGLFPVQYSSVAWGDHDNDGDLDILLTGWGSGTIVSKVYRNQSIVANTKPLTITNLQSTVDNGIVTLKWDRATDNETPQNGLSYSIYVYQTGQAGYEFSPNAFPKNHALNGRQLVSKIGNIQWKESGYQIKNLPIDKEYYWSVHAIDAGNLGGEFSPEQSFYVPLYRPLNPTENIVFSNIQLSKANSNWLMGSGDKRAVFINKTDSGLADPVDNTTYNVNDITTNGWKCIYNGTGSAFEVTDLMPDDYLIHVCEYNGTAGNEKYLVTSSTGNPEKLNTIYTKQTNIVIKGLTYSSSAWGDYDSDGDLDLLIIGQSGSSRYSIIYNNNAGIFNDISAGLAAVSNGSVAWGDYDNDDDLDIALTGYVSATSIISKIYRNDSGTFVDANIDLIGLSSSYIAWGDYDNDGDLDLLLSGTNTSNQTISKIYHNNGNATFTEQKNIQFDSMIKEWIDYNNDGYLDIVYNNTFYKNNRDNTFTKQTGILPSTSIITWGDYDNDGDFDALLKLSDGIKIFRNMGNESFVEVADLKFDYISSGTIAWGDYDNDGDLDILLSGNGSSSSILLSKVYRNDGGDTFTSTGIFIDKISNALTRWGDFDNDGDIDILLNGGTNSSPVSTIYKNNSLIVNEKPGVPSGLVYTMEGTKVILKWDRVANDKTNKRSILYNVKITNSDESSLYVSPHSNNDGTLKVVGFGNAQLDTTFIFRCRWDTTYYASVQAIDNSYVGGQFSNPISFNVEPIQCTTLSATIINSNTLKLKWNRGNGDKCIVFAKEGSSGTANPQKDIAYYPNANFAEGSPIENSDWYCIYKGVCDSVLLTGLDPKKNYVIHACEYQENDDYEVYALSNTDNVGVFSTGLITEQAAIQLPQLSYSSSVWGDYDNDGDLDLLLTGNSSSGRVSKIFRNDAGVFTDINAGLMGVSSGSAAWGDYDSDGDLDIVITGQSTNSSIYISNIYRNDGGIFNNINAGLIGVMQSSVAWGDYDNDGDLDLALIGYISSLNYTSKIYKNDAGKFNDINAGLPGVSAGSVAWGDYDNDGDLDLLLAGGTGLTNSVTKIYGNDSGAFTDINCGLINLYYSSVAWGDYDNDGDLDIAMIGYAPYAESRIYRNDNFTFTDINAGLTDLWRGSLAWGDYDNDGDLDLVTSGLDVNNITIIKLYENNKGVFSNSNITLMGVYNSSIAWGDYDGDGDLDLILTGITALGYFTRIYRNNTYMSSIGYSVNAKPEFPSGLYTNVTPSGYSLEWSPVINDETNSKTMSYNIRYRPINSSKWLGASHSSDNGYRKVTGLGNIQLNNSYNLKNLLVGKYYWQVQAVDQGYLGSEWSAIDSFEVKNIQAFFNADTVCFGLSSNFTDQSVATDGIASWYWDFGDGNTSVMQNPSHGFSASGAHNVKLVITSTVGDKDSLIKEVIVKSKPFVDFSATIVCQGSETALTNLTDKNGLTITSWQWDYGDGKGSVLENPISHGYLVAGDYQTRLYATVDNECKDSIQKTISVGAIPVATVTASVSDFCIGDSTLLSVQHNANYNYQWLNNNVDLTNAIVSSYNAKQTGNYSVRVVNPVGNCTTTSSSVTITTKPRPEEPSIINESMLGTICQGDSVKLLISPVSNVRYNWKLNGGATGANMNVLYAKYLGDYTMVLRDSTSGCEAISVNTIPITVNNKPDLPSVSYGTTEFCEGGSVVFSTDNNAALNYQWKNSAGIIPEATTNQYTATQTENYKLRVSNSNGCWVETNPVSVTVKPNPYTPVIETDTYEPGKCLGETPIRLDVGDPVSEYVYQWYRNGVPVSGETNAYIEGFLSEGDYMVEANLSGCKEQSEILNVYFEDAPEKPQILAYGPNIWYLACTDTTASQYKWYYNENLIQGANKYVYVANKNLGAYIVSIANDKGCFTRSDAITIPTGTTGVDDPDPFANVKIYPNPTPGVFTIEMENQVYGDLNIKIANSEVREILSIKFNKTTEHFSTQIDLSGQAKGMYFINLLLNKYKATRKLVVE